jgi:hypothetical protein
MGEGAWFTPRWRRCWRGTTGRCAPVSEPDETLEVIRQRLGELVDLRREHGLNWTEQVEYLDLVALEAEELAERDRRR